MTRRKAAGKPSRKTDKPKPRKQGHGLKIAFAILFLCGFLLGSLIFLSQLRERYQPEPVLVVNDDLLEDIQVELESALLRSGASLQNLRIQKQGQLTTLELAAPFPDARVIHDLNGRLTRLSPEVSLQSLPEQEELAILLTGVPRFKLQFTPPRQPEPVTTSRVAIIMDDLGADLRMARQLLDLKLPITFSILPNTRHAAEVATMAHRRGREVMLHIPMEPLGYPATNPGQNALLVSLSDAEIKRRFYSYLEKIPYAVGGNNHMGSRFTADSHGMDVVLKMMQKEGMFFVDSRTTGKSIAADEARRLGVPVASRDIFLDNDADVDKISRQIRKLAVLASKQGTAIALCHPYAETITALRQEEGFLLQQGVQVVAASALLGQ
jgi:polysaccharide deacetylase 2 family uncharacterized protein YibQ